MTSSEIIASQKVSIFELHPSDYITLYQALFYVLKYKHITFINKMFSEYQKKYYQFNFDILTTLCVLIAFKVQVQDWWPQYIRVLCKKTALYLTSAEGAALYLSKLCFSDYQLLRYCLPLTKKNKNTSEIFFCLFTVIYIRHASKKKRRKKSFADFFKI